MRNKHKGFGCATDVLPVDKRVSVQIGIYFISTPRGLLILCIFFFFQLNHLPHLPTSFFSWRYNFHGWLVWVSSRETGRASTVQGAGELQRGSKHQSQTKSSFSQDLSVPADILVNSCSTRRVWSRYFNSYRPNLLWSRRPGGDGCCEDFTWPPSLC